ncbi:vancomycin resistance protein YoaR [Neobacillus bataviensis]|uniref:Vancomycin resistance protein YoaR n=1 Tax=Neobacillus bataviensis TaxID=220685 RepID=A0A561DYM7_9BACI|nr:VanW family protein [Neobacillus bataviensis]TWE08422.1 vancomycin resistance protein YoaR [Neobacillus bataviensis]
MSRFTRIIAILLAGCLLGLAGCREQTTNEKEAIAAGQPKNTSEKQIKAEKKKKVEKPVFVNLIDPNTKSVVKTFKPKDIGFGTDDEKYKAELALLTRELARGTKDTPGYDKRMILDKLDENGQVIKGTPQTILEEKELTEKIIQASLKGGDVKIPLYATASGYKQEEAAQLGEVVVASYTTYFSSGMVGRSKNIVLSAKAINNVILGTGDSFSFNTTVGPSDAEHGYQPAPEALDGKLVEGIGGGICQTSSTLYNAIDKLAVSYIERNHHSLHVGYVPTGRDATVSYGGLDFRFKNTTGVPLLLKTVVRKGSITVEIRTAKVYQDQVKKN